VTKPDFESAYARYLAGEMTDEERQSFEEQVAADPKLSEEVYADANVAAALGRGKVVRGPAHWWRWAAPLAAAAIILLGINLMQPDDEMSVPVMRGSGAIVELMTPAGILHATPTRFEWAVVEGATRYRFELMDEQARVVNRTVVDSTFMVLEEGVPTSGAWRVVALDALGQAMGTSSPARFEVSP
jgi:hypothetical protein